MSETASKSDIIDIALKKSGIIGVAFKADGFTIEQAAFSLEMLMTHIENEGVLLGWKRDSNPLNPDIDEDSGLPDWSIDTITNMLSEKMLNPTGMVVIPSSLYSAEVIQREASPFQPIGAGNKIYNFYQSFQTIDDQITVGNDGVISE